jgi:formamidopyrimidine-DNA glycosylase
MPELPEVEVVKKSLDKKIKKLVINDVIILNKNLRYKIETKKFLKLKKTKIISIKRRSKYLLVNLSNKLTILVHLGMTGKFFIIDQNKKKYKISFYYSLSENDDKHDHLIIHFNKNIKLIYNDVRKFGFIKLLNSKRIVKFKSFKIFRT